MLTIEINQERAQKQMYDTEKNYENIIHLSFYSEQLQSKKDFIRLFTMLNVQL